MAIHINPFYRIILAAQSGRGVRLTAEETRLMARDPCIRLNAMDAYEQDGRDPKPSAVQKAMDAVVADAEREFLQLRGEE